MLKTSKIKTILDSIEPGARPEWFSFASRYKSPILRYPTEQQNAFLRDLEAYTRAILQQHPDLKHYIAGKAGEELCSSMHFSPDLFDNIMLVMQGNSVAAKDLFFTVAGQVYPLLKSKTIPGIGIIIGSIGQYKVLMEQISKHALEVNQRLHVQPMLPGTGYPEPSAPPYPGNFSGAFFPQPTSQASSLKQQINILLDAMRISGGCTVIGVNINPSGHVVEGRFYQYELIFHSQHDGESFAQALNHGMQDRTKFCGLKADRSKFYIKAEEHVHQCLARMRELEAPPAYDDASLSF